MHRILQDFRSQLKIFRREGCLLEQKAGLERGGDGCREVGFIRINTVFQQFWQSPCPQVCHINLDKCPCSYRHSVLLSKNMLILSCQPSFFSTSLHKGNT